MGCGWIYGLFPRRVAHLLAAINRRCRRAPTTGPGWEYPSRFAREPSPRHLMESLAKEIAFPSFLDRGGYSHFGKSRYTRTSMKIVYVVSDSPEEWNSAEWRCAIPARAIQSTRQHQATLIRIDHFAYHTPEAMAVCAEADIIVIQRNAFGPVLQAMQYWK